MFDDKLEQRKKLDKQLKREFVYVDAHLLSTPTIIDLDNDGSDDMIIPVSYFFDKYVQNMQLTILENTMPMQKMLESWTMM